MNVISLSTVIECVLQNLTNLDRSKWNAFSIKSDLLQHIWEYLA